MAEDETSSEQAATFTLSSDGKSVHVEDETADASIRLAVQYGQSHVGKNYTFAADVTCDNLDTELGLVVRGDVAAMHGYVLVLDPANAQLRLIKLNASGTATPFEQLASSPVSGSSITLGSTFRMVFEVNGSQLTGRLYSSSNPTGTPLATVTATDSAYTDGAVGTWARRHNVALEGSWSNLRLVPGATTAFSIGSDSCCAADADFEPLSAAQSPTFTHSNGSSGSSVHVDDTANHLAQLAIAYSDSGVGDNYVVTTNVTYDNTNTELGLIARGNLAKTQGYVLSLDPTNSCFSLIKLDPSASTTTHPEPSRDLVNDDLATRLGLTVTQNSTYKMSLEISGSMITGRLYNQAGTLLSTITTTDYGCSDGLVGAWGRERNVGWRCHTRFLVEPESDLGGIPRVVRVFVDRQSHAASGNADLHPNQRNQHGRHYGPRGDGLGPMGRRMRNVDAWG